MHLTLIVTAYRPLPGPVQEAAITTATCYLVRLVPESIDHGYKTPLARFRVESP